MVDTLTPAIASYLDHLAVERALSKNTLSSYRRDLNRYVEFSARTATLDVAGVSTMHIVDFSAWLREGDDEHPPLAASSAARTVVAVRGFHKFAASEGLTAADPAADVRPPTPPQRLPKALSISQVEDLLAAVSDGRTGRQLRDQALLEMLYGTGARISEAVGLDVDDLDVDSGAVRLSGKGGKQRVVPLGRYAQRALANYLTGGRPGLAEAAKAGKTSPACFSTSEGPG